MLKIFVEEAAALASITLFLGMIAVWAHTAALSRAGSGRRCGRWLHQWTKADPAQAGENRYERLHRGVRHGQGGLQRSPLMGESATIGVGFSLRLK